MINLKKYIKNENKNINKFTHPLVQYEHPYSLILSYPFESIPLCNFGFKS